jgi:coenzyme F420-dependent glucose-6-phosphate dehydrogenase
VRHGGVLELLGFLDDLIQYLIADDPSTIAARLEELEEQGFDRIALANTSPDPERLFEVMGEEVIPSV